MSKRKPLEVKAPDWRWRKLIHQAVSDATSRLGITQSELSVRLGVGREIMLWSRNPAPLPGYDYPRKGIGLGKAVELCREHAGWDEDAIEVMAGAWVEEGYWKVQREHIRSIRMLSKAAQAERWVDLGRIALETGKLP